MCSRCRKIGNTGDSSRGGLEKLGPRHARRIESYRDRSPRRFTLDTFARRRRKSLASGVDASKIVRVGNIMIDTLVAMKPAVESSQFLESISLEHDSHAMVTLHRPSNVDDPATLGVLLNELLNVAQKMDLIWPLHPRTKARIESLGRMDELLENKAIHLMGPLGYIDFMNGIMHSKCVITDSGGIQKRRPGFVYHALPCAQIQNVPSPSRRNQCPGHSGDASGGIGKN